MTPADLVRDLTAFSVQLTLVVVVVAVVLKLVRVPARARYVCLRVALAACLALPWLLRTSETEGPPAPPVQIPSTVFAPRAIVDEPPASARSGDVAAVSASSAASLIPWTNVLFGALVAGVLLRSGWLAVGLLRLRRLRTRASSVGAPEYEEVQRQLGTCATIVEVPGLTQPATFGVRRPVVLLPEALTDAPPTLRIAVVTHELFHVRRRDWLSVLGEEAIRTAFWFHPAIHWLTSSIQLAREEVVDELTVRLTGDRRTYMQALIAFADGTGLRSAPAFAHRRQLFHRILSVSKEKVMSRSRIVMSAGVLVAAVLGTAWYASTLFPIVSAAKVDRVSLAESPLTNESMIPDPYAVRTRASFGGQLSAQNAPRPVVRVEQRPDEAPAHAVTPENPIPRRTRNISPAWPSQFAGERLQVVVSARVRVERDGTVTRVFRDQCSTSTETVCQAFFEASAAAIRQWRYERPVQAPIEFTVMVSFRPGAEPVITQAGSDWAHYVREAQDSLRVLAENTGGLAVARTPNQRTEDFLREDLAELTNRYRELEREQAKAAERIGPRHPEMMKLQAELARLNAEMARIEQQMVAPSGRIPLRIAPGVPGPRVIQQTRPVYTQEAMAARSEGTVVLEVLVDERGFVPEARVIRSIPLLDESALNTIKQWRFTPTLLNGEPVPVLVQVEMQFTLK